MFYFSSNSNLVGTLRLVSRVHLSRLSRPQASRGLVDTMTDEEAEYFFSLPIEGCRVYWGSHGCMLPRGHDGPHVCDCAFDEDIDPDTRRYPDGTLNVGAPPYYGEDTSFYGEDA